MWRHNAADRALLVVFVLAVMIALCDPVEAAGFLSLHSESEGDAASQWSSGFIAAFVMILCSELGDKVG